MASSTSGKGLRVTFAVGNTIMTGVTTSDVTEVGDELDATDSDTAPYISTDIGCTGLKVQIKGNKRSDGNIYANFTVGTLLTNVKIYPNGSTNPFWVMPLAVVLPGSNSSSVRGKVEYTVNIASQGTYTAPTA